MVAECTHMCHHHICIMGFKAKQRRLFSVAKHLYLDSFVGLFAKYQKRNNVRISF